MFVPSACPMTNAVAETTRPVRWSRPTRRRAWWAVAFVLVHVLLAAAVASADPGGSDAAPAMVDAGGRPAVSTPAAAPPAGSAAPTGSAEQDGVATSTPAATATVAPEPGEVIKAILGLIAILVLAYLAGHPRVQELEQLLGISEVVTAGFPFLILGHVAHLPSVGILSSRVLHEVQPFIPLGLGWIGFTMGFRFDVRGVEKLPRGFGAALAVTTALPFGAIVGACGLTLLAANGWGQATFLRDAVILGTAGVIGVGASLRRDGAEDRIAPLVHLQEGCAMLGLILLAAFWRPQGDQVGWQLPAIAWIFVTIGMGTALGAVIYAVLSAFTGAAEVTLLMLGSILLTSGMASFLRLSPIAVCFIAGALIFNFPGTWKEPVRLALHRLERPVYLVFLVVAGALWQTAAWEGWLLLALFAAARLIGKWLAVYVLRRQEPGAFSDAEQFRIAVAPMGALAIAIIVNAQDLYRGATVSWMVTTVIGGAIATEIAVQITRQRFRRPGLRDSAPVIAAVAPPAEEPSP